MSTSGKNFFDRVYVVVKKIPRGRASSYGAIADYLGTGLSARMVGWAMNNCPSKIPAHRVVNRQGLLTGKHHFSTPTLMKELLESEGVEVEDDQIKNFKKIFWDPEVELKPSSRKQKFPPKKKLKAQKK